MAAPDVIVCGGGHNGLAAAAYLARAGRSVLVLERRARFGGAVASERPWPGIEARLSRYAYLVSLLPETIVRELGLRIRLAERSVAAYADGLLVEADAAGARTRASFPSAREHDAFLAWGALLGAAAERFWPSVCGPVPSRAQARALLGDELWDALVQRPLGEALGERFSDPLVRGMVATDGLIGTFASLHEPSLVQNRCFLYHVIGGGDGRWRVPVGGMGLIGAELERAARAAGADLRACATVTGVDGTDVTWEDPHGEHTASATWVLLGHAPHATRAEGAQLKVNLLLERLPALRDGTPPELAFAGTLRVCERYEQLERAYAQAAAGALPDEPPAELYCHTLADRSILGPADAASARQTLTIFGLHAPARLFAHDAGAKQRLVDRTLDALDRVLAEPIRPLLVRDALGEPCLEAKVPQDLEAELGLPGGHIFHGDLAWPWDDPDDGAPGGRWGVETGHPRVLVCGAGARRGGGVSALGGRDAAMHVLGR